MIRSIVASVPRVHPAGDLMADYVAGQVHRFERWLIESHLEFCAVCREIAAAGARVGGHWLMGLEPSGPESVGELDFIGLPDALWQRLSTRLAHEPDPDFARWPDISLPTSIRHEVEVEAADSAAWVHVKGSTSRSLRAAFDPVAEVELYLVRTPAGESFPTHRHLGGELTLVLSGSLRDDYTTLRAGDFWNYPAGTSHAPHIGREGECVAMSCVRGGLDFES